MMHLADTKQDGASTRSGFALLITILCILGLALAGCGGKKEKKELGRLKGKRLSVIALEEQVAVDPTLADVQIRLPAPYRNSEWPQVGGWPHHALHHLELSANPRVVWKAKIGSGASKNHRMISQPVVADGKVFTMDPEWKVAAFNFASGKKIWTANVKDKGESKASAFGGGVAYDDGKLFISVGSGYAAALDANSGAQLWRTDFEVALRGAPTAANGQVYITSHDNQLFALDDDTGEILWSHVAISEAAGLLGTASPAVVGNTIVAVFSSGEIFALRADNGRVSWTDSLTRTGRLTALSSLNDIDGLPVVDRGVVYAVGHSGRMASINLRTGERVWENNLESAQTPWVAGDFIYVVTLNAEVICLSRQTGKIRWMKEIQQWRKNDKKKDQLVWSGPILAGDRLLIVNDAGFAVSMSPYTGEFLGAIKIPKKGVLAPIVVDGTLLILGNNGTLIAMR